MENWSQSIQQMIDIIDRCIRQQEDEALTLRALSAALGYSESYVSLRLFLARGVHPRIPRRLWRDPQRVPPAPDGRRPPHHLEAFRLLSAWHRRNGHGRID